MRISDWSSDVCSSDLLLRNTYEAIRTNGLVDEADPGFYTTRKLANRHAEHRELVFKDGDAWMRYDRKYGTGNPFTAIMGHLRGMSQNIASLERFGPNPDATVRPLLDRREERRVGNGCVMTGENR